MLLLIQVPEINTMYGLVQKSRGLFVLHFAGYEYVSVALIVVSSDLMSVLFFMSWNSSQFTVQTGLECVNICCCN